MLVCLSAWLLLCSEIVWGFGARAGKPKGRDVDDKVYPVDGWIGDGKGVFF